MNLKEQYNKKYISTVGKECIEAVALAVIMLILGTFIGMIFYQNYYMPDIKAKSICSALSTPDYVFIKYNSSGSGSCSYLDKKSNSNDVLTYNIYYDSVDLRYFLGGRK